MFYSQNTAQNEAQSAAKAAAKASASQAGIQKLKNRINYLKREAERHLGMHVTKDGDEVLQTSWGEFDSHRLQLIAFVPQLEQEDPCKFSFVSSNLTEGLVDPITQPVEYAPFKREVVGSNPTGVKNRLIAQRIERLASNEKVPGSNPGRAAFPSLAQRTEHGATNADSRRFESCMRVKLPLAQPVAQVPYKNKVERSSRSRKKKCTVAQLAEHSAVNGGGAGSNPACAAIMDVKRIGKRSVLKTDARKGCGFESLQRPPRTNSTMVVHALDKRSVPGSSPGSCN